MYSIGELIVSMCMMTHFPLREVAGCRRGEMVAHTCSVHHKARLINEAASEGKMHLPQQRCRHHLHGLAGEHLALREIL